MRNIQDLSNALPLLKCLGSDIRVAILELLIQEGPQQMSDISSSLGITSGSLSPHMKMLADNGLISIKFDSGKRGIQKICSIAEDRIIIDLENYENKNNMYEAEIGVGQYSDYKIYPTCGISTPDHVIGDVDSARFFASPERFNAGILWFTEGYIEYMIPNYITEYQSVVELLFSFEISSEAPGVREDWPSDIQFSINGVELCTWTSPGDFGTHTGIYTPEWWNPNWNQYGLLKFLSINETGTYIDGFKKSDVTISELNITAESSIKLRMTVSKESEHCGGLTLFGRSFGNYNQDIKIRMHYKET